MITIGNIGRFESIPQILNDVLNENISALEEHLLNGWKLNKAIRVGKYTELSPLDFALIMEKFQSIKWLTEKGANLNAKEHPSFLLAVRYCNEEVIRFLVSHGAKIDVMNNVGSEAFLEAYYGKRFANFSIIQELGHTAAKYGGQLLRHAVSDRNYKILEFLIEHGADINYNKSDMVYSNQPTPLCVAARYVDLEMCKFLVKHGADVTIAEKDGMRPYSIALEKGDEEMAEYFKSLEPSEFHQTQNKLDELKPYKLPKKIIEFLNSENLHFDLADSDFGYIEFFKLIDTIPFKFGRQKLLRLSRSLGDYSHIYIVWNPKTKKIASYDMEHEELIDLASFDDFIEDMTKYMNLIFTLDNL